MGARPSCEGRELEGRETVLSLWAWEQYLGFAVLSLRRFERGQGSADVSK